jgi:hypothetical protein
VISYERYLALLKTIYPESARALSFEARLSPLLICPETIALPGALKKEAEEIVRAYFALRSLPERTRALEAVEPVIGDPGNTSALMSYDFHVDASGHLRLIEINTNASLSLLVDALHEAHGIKNPFVEDFRTDIVSVFRDECAAAGIRSPKAVAIVDETPESQRLYIEFVLYRELFSRAGLTAHICDPQELRVEGAKLLFASATSIDLVYNRHTDFYLQNAEASVLHDAMTSKVACLSPHPHEYRLLADKERLLELSRPDAIDALALSDEHKGWLKRSLIATREVKEFKTSEELWASRKHWFFKPKRSYGGKATYRGASISKSVFAKVFAGDYLAQEFVPAPEVKVSTGETFKYDLRFFVYRDRIQLGCARLYQGQMTNTQTPGGGVTPIVWT